MTDEELNNITCTCNTCGLEVPIARAIDVWRKVDDKEYCLSCYNENELIRKNTLIAEYMGYEKTDEGYTDPFQHEGLLWQPYEFAFNYDWHWLIHIVKKISKDYNVIMELHDGENTTTTIFRFDGDDTKEPSIQVDGEDIIDTTFKAVCEFVEWYYKNNKHDTEIME